MKTKKIAAAVLAPAAVTGTVLLGWATVHASADHPARQVTKAQALAPTHRQVANVAAKRHPANHQRLRAAARPPAHKTSTARKTSTAHKIGTAHKVGAARKASAVKQAAATGPVSRPPAPPPPPQPAAASPASLTTGMSAFEQCVAWRESGDNPTASSAGLFGILPSTWASLGYAGTAGQAPVALQKAAFDRLYAQDGTSPWAAYDGC